jgi:hypothetical protein
MEMDISSAFHLVQDNMYYIGAFGLIFIGIFIMLVKHNLIKVIIGLSILETGVNLFLVSVGYISKGTAPIFSKSSLEAQRRSHSSGTGADGNCHRCCGSGLGPLFGHQAVSSLRGT